MMKKRMKIKSLLDNREPFDVDDPKRMYYTPVQKKNHLKPLPIRSDIQKRMNKRLKMDGLKLLKKLDKESIRVAFFDPAIQYCANPMDLGSRIRYMDPPRINKGVVMESYGSPNDIYESVLCQFIRAYDHVLVPSGFLFMWADELSYLIAPHLFNDTELFVRNFVTWDIGEVVFKHYNGRKSRFKDMSNLLIVQKHPNKTQGHWFDGWFLDYYSTGMPVKSKAIKPVELQANLIKASTLESDLVVDAAAGSFSVFKACKKTGRNFLGCDIR